MEHLNRRSLPAAPASCAPSRAKAWPDVLLVALHVPSGVPSQVLEALAMQKVVVASKAALEGVRVLPDTEVPVASDAADYLHRIAWALASPAAAAIAKAARARVAREHDWAASFAPLAARLDGAPCPAAGAL